MQVLGLWPLPSSFQIPPALAALSLAEQASPADFRTVILLQVMVEKPGLGLPVCLLDCSSTIWEAVSQTI